MEQQDRRRFARTQCRDVGVREATAPWDERRECQAHILHLSSEVRDIYWHHWHDDPVTVGLVQLQQR